MKHCIAFLPIAFIFILACNNNDQSPTKKEQPSIDLNGTWQLFQGITITKSDSVFTDYTKDQQMIKIINTTHFAFLKHSINVPKDSSLNFDAGGGSYNLVGDQYTEHLDFYNDKNWQGKSFTFTVSLKNDTLIQKGIEKVEGTGVDHEIIEKYVKVKS